MACGEDRRDLPGLDELVDAAGGLAGALADQGDGGHEVLQRLGRIGRPRGDEHVDRWRRLAAEPAGVHGKLLVLPDQPTVRREHLGAEAHEDLLIAGAVDGRGAEGLGASGPSLGHADASGAIGEVVRLQRDRRGGRADGGGIVLGVALACRGGGFGEQLAPFRGRRIRLAVHHEHRGPLLVDLGRSKSLDRFAVKTRGECDASRLVVFLVFVRAQNLRPSAEIAGQIGEDGLQGGPSGRGVREQAGQCFAGGAFVGDGVVRQFPGQVSRPGNAGKPGHPRDGKCNPPKESAAHKGSCSM